MTRASFQRTYRSQPTTERRLISWAASCRHSPCPRRAAARSTSASAARVDILLSSPNRGPVAPASSRPPTGTSFRGRGAVRRRPAPSATPPRSSRRWRQTSTGVDAGCRLPVGGRRPAAPARRPAQRRAVAADRRAAPAHLHCRRNDAATATDHGHPERPRRACPLPGVPSRPRGCRRARRPAPWASFAFGGREQVKRRWRDTRQL